MDSRPVILKQKNHNKRCNKILEDAPSHKFFSRLLTWVEAGQ